jgi:hypothetical protein
VGSISDRSSAGFPILCVAEFRDDMIGGGTSTCMVVEFYQVFLCAHNSGYAYFHLCPFSLEYIYEYDDGNIFGLGVLSTQL